MRIVFAGTPDVALPSLERLAAVHDVVAVVTRHPAPQGRSSTPQLSPVAIWAKDNGIEILDPVSPRDPRLLARLVEIAPDCCPVVAFGGLITPQLLSVPRLGWVNLHFSLLPHYRGAAPVQRAILAGESATGITVFRLVQALDAGPIFVQSAVEMDPQETAGDLLARMAVLGADLLIDALELAEQGVAPREQSADGISLAPKITSEDARISALMTCANVVNTVRAMSPDPGAWAEIDGRRFSVLRARPSHGVPDGGRVGELVATKRQLLWHVADSYVELVEVQASGKRIMSGPDWARGAWKEGMTLG